MSTKGLKFNIFGIILMMLSIWGGTAVGQMITAKIGFPGGIIGAVVIGYVIYLVWCLLSGHAMDWMDGLLFAVLTYLAELIMQAISGVFGFGAGLIGLLLSALVLSFLVGAVLGAKEAPIALPQGAIGKTRKKG